MCLFVPISEEEDATSDMTETLFVIFISGVQQQNYKVTYKKAKKFFFFFLIFYFLPFVDRPGEAEKQRCNNSLFHTL